MRLRTMLAGAAALALVACTKPPLDEQQKTALADSIEQWVAGPMMSTFEHPNVDAILALYAPGNDVQVVENGTISPGRDSIAKGVRDFWGRPRLTAHFTVGFAQVAVLSRDAAVYSGMLTGAVKDSAGVETPMRFAYTAVVVRTGGGWKIQAEHASAPAAPAPVVSPKPARPRR